MRNSLMLAIVLGAAAELGVAAPLTLTSPEQQATVLELFTSEGCSSCPPADRWISRLKDHPDLWQTLVPVAFHVDYWNYLGWVDPFADAGNTQRQASYQSAGLSKSVYTPQWIWRGAEWRGWFQGESLPSAGGPMVGRLSARIADASIDIDYSPSQFTQERLVVHRTLLGFGVTSKVMAGENSGRILNHDFVVLAHEQASLEPDAAGMRYQWRGAMPQSRNKHAAERYGIALWVSRPADPAPLQAVGGWLPAR